MQLFRNAIWILTKLVLSLRYRLQIHGQEQLRELKGPVLILPNHPAYTDPVLVLTALWPWLRPRPVLYEENFRNPLLYPVAKLLRAVKVPDLERASVRARERTTEAVAEVIDGLRRGENFVLWPAGHIQRDGIERLGGARAAAEILQAVPEAQVVLVRTRGLWGSMFSFAPTGNRPRLIRNLWKSVGLLLATLQFVFMPRRKVDITVELVGRGKLPEPRRETLNPWLEAWYNEGGPEAPTFVPYHFLFGPRTFEFPKKSGLASADLSRVRSETKTAIAEILAQRLGRKLTEEEQAPETTFDQLGLDSLDRMEVTLAVEQRFGFHGDDVPATIGQLWALAEGLVEREPPKPPPPAWFRRPADEGPLAILGETIPEAFVARALANRRDIAAADDLSGVLTYERLLIGALILSRRFATLPNANIGVLLPASVACDVVFLALHLAGKLPVLLNWTTGPKNLAHAARLMGLNEVVTSRPFIDRTGVTVEGVSYLFLEDLRKEISRLELLRTLLTVRLRPGHVRAGVPQVAADRPAMVLFTSGSERAPKAVPLTHANIVSEISAGAPFLRLMRRDSLLGFLPAFHSFGIVATSLFPLLGGMRVVHHPDPTDASRLARKIASYQPTLLVGTPTFVGYIIDRSQPGELSSLRLIVVGAEKCPASLFEACARAAPQAALLEGYGVTECSPVVAVNRPEANRPGTVGQPLPGVDVRVVDLETEKELPPGQLGMLWVSGPTVFPGYLGFEGPAPFRERDGKRWYVTGDLAEIDADGFIRLAGRLKRFLKAGGEMISLPALEEPFARRYPPTDKGPRVAVEGIETDGGRRIVLFTTEPITLSEANALLLQEGFRGVLRFDEVRQVDQIPVLGTGKVDYKVLRAQIETEAQRGAPCPRLNSWESEYMRYLAMACDYDGTLADHGRVDEQTLASLERLVSSGRKLILVTGRELPDLQSIFPQLGLFEWVVAENGALLYQPALKQEKALAEPPPEQLIRALRERAVQPLSVGKVIVATCRPHAAAALEAIQTLGLEYQAIFNKGSVMLLPTGIDKATGLLAALQELALSPQQVVGVGDAENDHAFLNLCGCAAAVANALPAVKESADLVTCGDHGRGVREIIDLLLADDLGHSMRVAASS